MLCLSGFELYSRWVPPNYEHKITWRANVHDYSFLLLFCAVFIRISVRFWVFVPPLTPPPKTIARPQLC